jgi:diguanylate cyclase (GGDEF)-like protein/PAS domain S-box-containing protein
LAVELPGRYPHRCCISPPGQRDHLVSRFRRRMSELLRRPGADAACHRERPAATAPAPSRPSAPGEPPSDAEWLRSLMDNASNLILFKDTAGNYRCVNRQFGLMLGKPQREILGRSDHELLPGEAAAVIAANDRQVLRLLASMSFEEELPTPAGARTFLMTKFPVFHAEGEVSGIGCVGVDITEREAYRHQLRRERERAVVTLSSIGEGVIACDPECDVEYMNPVAEALLGTSFADVVGRPLGEALRLRDEISGERLDPLHLCLGDSGGLRRNGVLVRADGSELPVEETTSAIRGRDGEMLGTVMILRDASSSRSLARRLSHEANHDPLTGLYNRREFDRVLRAAMEQAREQGVRHVLAHMDLDRFKQVNDLGGHEAGDTLLRELSELLRRHLRGEDVMARLGGDEFGVLLHRCDLAAAMRVAEELRVAAERYRLLHGVQG